MYEVERDHDEIIVKSDFMWDVIDDYTLVLSLRQAKRLSEALLERTATVDVDGDGEDG